MAYAHRDAASVDHDFQTQAGENADLPVVAVVTAVPVVPGSHQAEGLTTTEEGLPSVPAGATHALIQADGGTVRWTEDGTTPTGTLGFKLADGNAAEVTNLADVQVRAESGTCTLQVSYRRYDS